MKLLAKKEIDKQKAIERKQTVDEGVKLAERVDKLREMNAQEQKNLLDFREKSLKAAMAELNGLSQQRNELEAELVQLKAERQALMQPLDKEWEKLESERDALTDLETAISQKETQLALQAETFLANIKDLEIEKHLIEAEKAKTAENLTLSEKMRGQATETLAEARNDAKRSASQSSLKEEELADRESELATKERDVDNQRAYNEKERYNNAIERLKLQDLAKTLEKVKKQLNG